MVKLEEQLEKIKDVQRQISTTESWKRRRDLRKYANKLWREYNTAKRYLQTAGR